MEEKKCYVCEGTKPESIFSHRCEKHDVCISCGINRKDLDEAPWATIGGFICKRCEENRINDKIEKFQKDNEGEDEFFDDVIICPYCGEKHEADGEDSAFYSDGDHKFRCADCQNEFDVNTYVSFSYTTSLPARQYVGAKV